MSAPALTRPAPGPLVAALRDTAVVARRNLRHVRREPRLVMFSLVQPMILLLAFNFVFGGALEATLPAGIQFIDFALPGLAVQVIALGTSQTAVGMAQDLDQGLIDRFRSLPMSRTAVLGGRICADALRIGLTTSVVFALGAALGFDFATGAARAVAGIAFIVAVGVTLSVISAAIGMLVRHPETAQVAGLVWLFPLTFTSSAFVRIETFDAGLEAFARENPVTAFVDTARGLLLGGPAFPLEEGAVIRALAWMAGIVLVFGLIGVRQYRRLDG